MLKGSGHSTIDTGDAKRGSSQKHYVGPLESGLNRRAFLRTGTAISLLGGLLACKPEIPAVSIEEKKDKSTPVVSGHFTDYHKEVLDAVQMHLFPADGDGPSARDISAIAYLEWAMTDLKNVADGDPEFIVQGIGWLDDLSAQTRGDKFVTLNTDNQDKVLQQIAKSEAGQNWMSILLYYLTEALLLDPVYGGNTNQIGWQWLEHQAGFPRPVKGKTYRDFE